MKLILIRHGETEALEKDLYYGGGTDLPLSLGGRAKLEASVAAGNYPDFTGFRIITSGMKRTEETLEIIVGKIPHEKIYAFHEMELGIFEMHSYEELKDRPEYQKWISGDFFANVCPCGESAYMMHERAQKALKAVIEEGRDAALFIHGGVIFGLMKYLFPREVKIIYDWQPHPGGGYIIDLPAGYVPPEVTVYSGRESAGFAETGALSAEPVGKFVSEDLDLEGPCSHAAGGKSAFADLNPDAPGCVGSAAGCLLFTKDCVKTITPAGQDPTLL